MQRGVHPRIGAIDVIPFVPIANAAMDDCVRVARTVGAAIGEQFLIPVYLYEEASDRPWRKHLEDIRRGQFEGLAAKMAADGWTPDFGPSAPHPTAGAVVVDGMWGCSVVVRGGRRTVVRTGCCSSACCRPG